MNTLERALIEKSGRENGWENVQQSDENAIILSSARHRASTTIRPATEGEFCTIEPPPGLIAQEMLRAFPNNSVDGKLFQASQPVELAIIFRRMAELALSLPNQAAITYVERLKNALSEKTDPSECQTEVERMVKQRVGQDTFREALLAYWGGTCALTGITVKEILRASHIKPWSDCQNDNERLDVYNGLLLCANLDALFDRGLISFNQNGLIQISTKLNSNQRKSLNLSENMHLLWISPEHQKYLHYHNKQIFQ
ncbi:MAG: HNH endonuclease [Candidatus Riflebacteria bacterium]|nr:HNH endonuclease [Candidatus Riflebacteria bacterium]